MTVQSVKERRITVHGHRVSEQDWRGFLGILTTVGYLIIVGVVALRHEFSETLAAAGLLSTP